MAVFNPSYPLDIPTASGFVNSQLQLARTTAITSSSFTYQSQVQQFEGEVWTADFRLGDPDNNALLGAATGTIRVNGAGQTGNQVALDGFANSTNNVLKAGDYIQINSYMYLVTANVNSNGSGEANVNIEPALRQSIETINDNTIITYGANAKTIWRLDTNNIGWEADKVSNYGFNFTCTEAL